MIRPGAVSSSLGWHPAVVVWTEFSRLFLIGGFAGLFRSHLLHLLMSDVVSGGFEQCGVVVLW